MGIDNKNDKKTMTAVEILSSFYDGAVYTELLPELDSEGAKAEAITACGKVNGMSVYAFVQCMDRFDGAMSIAQANKLVKLYELAVKTGYPVVGFYRDSTGRVMQGNMLLDVLGELLSASSTLSGVVPQISVVLGNCVSTTALLAANADFVIKTESAKLSVSDSCCDGSKSAAFIAPDEASAVAKAVELLGYLPANNLSAAPFASEAAVGECSDFDSVFDKDSKLTLFEKYSDVAELSFRTLDTAVVGTVMTTGKSVDNKTAKKIANFVRFCDAFSIPVITAVDTEGFECLGGAKTILSAYAEATTPKLSVITGNAVGMAYLSLAGKGAKVDAVIGVNGAVVSPVAPKAAAYIALSDKLSGTVAEQDKQIDEYIKSELSVENAAKQGFIDDISDYQNLRAKLASYLDILSAKREETLPKKHPTI